MKQINTSRVSDSGTNLLQYSIDEPCNKRSYLLVTSIVLILDDLIILEKALLPPPGMVRTGSVHVLMLTFTLSLSFQLQCAASLRGIPKPKLRE